MTSISLEERIARLDQEKKEQFLELIKLQTRKHLYHGAFHDLNSLDDLTTLAKYALLSPEVFKLYLEKDTELFKSIDKYGNTIFYYAVFLGNIELVEFVAKNNAQDLNAPLVSRFTAMDVAVINENFEMVKLLVNAGASANSRHTNLSNINNRDLYDFLVKNGAVPSVDDVRSPAEVLEKFKPIFEFLENINGSKSLHTTREECLESQVPHNLFYIWLTNPAKPNEAPVEHLSIVNSSMIAFRNGTNYTDWNYKFYTNAPGAIPNTSAFFNSMGFKIYDINQEFPKFLSGSLIDVFIKHSKWGLAADLARYELLNNQGGVYLDLNFNLTRSLDHEVCAYSYVNFYTYKGECTNFRKLHPENYFFISAPEYPVLTNTINYINSKFYGSDPEKPLYWANLNATNRGLTDNLYGYFSFFNSLYLTNTGIIYGFCNVRDDTYRHHNNSDQPKTHFDDRYYQLIKSIGEFGHKIHAQCTNTDFILLIGNDVEIVGSTWV